MTCVMIIMSKASVVSNDKIKLNIIRSTEWSGLTLIIYKYYHLGDETRNYKRALRIKSKKFQVIDGLLYYISSKGKDKDQPRLVIRDVSERFKIIKAVHEQGKCCIV